MADRLISAETFHEKLEEVMHDRKKSGMPWNQLAVAHVVANDCHTVDAQPVVHGRWETVEDGYCFETMYRCSACREDWVLNDGTPHDNNMNFCPNCGARMDGGDTNA